MTKIFLTATSALTLIASPALAADTQPGTVETVEIEMSEERRALALAAVDAYWPQGLTAYTTNYIANEFADELLYTPLGELVQRYGIVEMAGELGEMIDEIESMERELKGEEEAEEAEGPFADVKPEQALKGMVAMFEDQRLIDMFAGQDEHLEERIAIVREVVAEEMPVYAAQVEPEMRMHFAEMFARRFDDQELRDIAAFAATDTGRKYAKQQWVMFLDPSYLRAMLSGAPESIKLSVAMIEKLKERMAHLPPMFPEPESDDADEATETSQGLIEEAEALEQTAAELLEEAAALRARAATL